MKYDSRNFTNNQNIANNCSNINLVTENSEKNKEFSGNKSKNNLNDYEHFEDSLV